MKKLYKEAMLYDKLDGNKCRCNICEKRCVIQQGRSGYCKTRYNDGGKLYSVIYGRVASQAISPIEKKPMYHFYPGSLWLSTGSVGCNFYCPGCQNFDLTFVDVMKEINNYPFISPEKSVKIALREGCKGISWTYNEPALWFEYTLETAKLAKKAGLLTNYVTNGYMTEEALYMIAPCLDSFRVDIKGFSKKFYREICHVDDFTPVLSRVTEAKKYGIHVEIITNVIPSYSDDDEQLEHIASWIADNAGRDTPWHVTRFYPHLKLSRLSPTPVKTLEKARQIGLNNGLHYVYLGNVPGHAGENTCCHACGKLLIERYGMQVCKNLVRENKCPYCGNEIPGRFS